MTELIINKKNTNGAVFKEVNVDVEIKSTLNGEDTHFNEKTMLKSYNVENIDENFFNTLHTYENALNYWYEIPQKQLDVLDSMLKHIGTNEKIDDNINYYLIDNELGTHEKLDYNLSDAINGYYYSLLTLFEECMTLNQEETEKAVHALFSCHIRMKAMEIYWRDHQSCPTMKQYIWKSRQDWRYKIIPTMMSKLNPKAKSHEKLENIMSLLFTIYYEYQDVLNEIRDVDVEVDGPIAKGTYIFPVVHAAESKIDSHKLLEILRQKIKTPEVKQYFIDILKECGSWESIKINIESLKKAALKEVKKIGGNPLMEMLIEQQFHVEN